MEEKVIISLEGVCKEFGGTTVVDNFNLQINKGEFVTFLGPSGCGKSTTLRMIAGLETPSSGSITLNGEEIVKIPPYKRPINTVFQRYALFPYLDVYDNVAFGLKLKKVPVTITKKNGQVVTKMKHLSKEEIDRRVLKALTVVDLAELENSHQLPAAWLSADRAFEPRTPPKRKMISCHSRYRFFPVPAHIRPPERFLLP